MTDAMMTETPMFQSAQDAITFALHYSHDQSPSNTMAKLMKRTIIGSGKGLFGIDGAHQAGTIRQVLGTLKPMEMAILVVRFGDVRSQCHCCGSDDAPSKAWRDAVDAVSFIEPIEDLHPRLRHAIVEKIVCRKKMVRVTALASRYETEERTIRRRIVAAKPVLHELEGRATSWIQDALQARGVVV